MTQGKSIDPSELTRELCTPVGTLTFRYGHPKLFDPEAQEVLFAVAAEKQYFRIERQPGLLLKFFHSSPGTGTRVATIEMGAAPTAERVEIALGWSPSEMGFAMRLPGGQVLSAKGVQSDMQIRIGENGQVFHSGGPGVEVASVRMTQAGKNILEPSAIEVWKETIRAIETLSTGTSSEGFIYTVVQTNLTISMLVTGFETYTKKRFKELEGEGVVPDVEALVDAMYSKRDLESGIQARLLAEAQEEGKTILSHVADNRINFQNFDRCRLAYNKTYGIRFGDLPSAEKAIAAVREFIRYRHRIVHVSPLLATLAAPGDAAGTTEPIFANAATAMRARKAFEDFINALHAGTLRLM